MAEGRGKRYSTGDAIKAIFADEDSNDESFDCGYDLDIIPDSENEGDSESSDVDIQIEGLRLQESKKALSEAGYAMCIGFSQIVQETRREG